MEEAIELLEELVDKWETEGTLGNEESVAEDLTKALNLLINDASREDY